MSQTPSNDWSKLIAEFEASHDGWTVRSELGRGASAAVFLVDTPSDQVALKLYKPEFFAGENAAAERFRLSLQKGLIGHDCSSLVNILETGELGQSAFVTMEYVPWPSMDRVLGAVKPDNIPKLMASIAQGAIWLHNKGLVHRDIKPANILVDPSMAEAKLVDLGVVRLADGGEGDLTDHGGRKPFIATAQYSSPEYLFRLAEPSPELWQGLTIYQLGAVLHDLLNTHPLFRDEVASENRYVLAMAVLQKSPTFNPNGYPARWAALARRALAKDLRQRLSAVRLSDFADLRVVNLDAVRRRLKLSHQIASLDQQITHQREQERLQRDSVIAELRAYLGHQLASIGKKTRWLSGNDGSIVAVLQLSESGEYFVAVGLTVCSERGVLELDLKLALQREDGLCACEKCPSRLIWTGTRERFTQDLPTDIIPQIEEAVLVALDESESLLETGAIKSLSFPKCLEDVI